MKFQTWFLVKVMFILSIGLMTTSAQAQTGGCSTTHIVQRGETLYRIAQSYRTTVVELQARNNIVNVNRIFVGQQLCINGGFVPAPAPTPIPDNSQQVGIGTVTAYFLNVRSGPGIQHGVLRVVKRNDTFPVVGRNSESTWYQITVDAVAGAKGWVSASYMNTPNPQNLPVMNDGIAPYSANITLIQTANIHITLDGNQGIVPQQISAGTTVRVIGRNASSTWFQITTANGNGWIKREALPNEFARDLFPITG